MQLHLDATDEKSKRRAHGQGIRRYLFLFMRQELIT